MERAQSTAGHGAATVSTIDTAGGGTGYTCPMHPQVRQEGPGACPVCGMALEPVTVSADDGPNPELVDMTRRLWVAVALAAPVVALEMGAHLIPAVRAAVPAQVSTWVQLVPATPVVLWAGWPFFVRGWASVRTRHLNMFTLVALGTGVAWTFSVVAVLAPGIFPADFRGPDGVVDVYLEPAAVITVLVLVGQVLELRARERTSGAVRALLDLTPPTAHLVDPDGSERDVDLAQVAVGDVVRVRPGEKVPVDGTVVSGRAAVEESMVTGESMPVTKVEGDAVIGGTLASGGPWWCAPTRSADRRCWPAWSTWSAPPSAPARRCRPRSTGSPRCSCRWCSPPRRSPRWCGRWSAPTRRCPTPWWWG